MDDLNINTESNMEKEMTETVQERVIKNEKGVYIHKFRKPFEYEGKKFETLNFYFNRLTGKDIINVETEMATNNEYALTPEVSRGFQYRIAAHASNVGSDVILNMPIYEFNKITNECRNFLISVG